MNIETPKLVDYFQDFTLWTKIHYYAIRNRKFYPNLFFFHFPFNGILIKEMTEDEREAAETKIQKMTDAKIDEIDKLLENKEKEIMAI